jgi:hypothetical protein
MEHINLGLIESGLSLARNYADRAYDSARGRQYSEIASDIRFIEEAKAELSKLYRYWSDISNYISSKEKSYDNYVTAPERGCTCHINPPCSYCENNSDDDYGSA